MKSFFLKFACRSLLATALVITCSCKKFFDVKPSGQVDETNHYQNVSDANAAVIGIYGQLMKLAGQYVVLNELRADLMSPTANADQYLKQLNTHSVTPGNPWADPKPFFSVILNCNDALAHFDKMRTESKMNDSDYQQRYSDVGAIRAWVYLQLGIHFGSVPYVTDPLSNIQELKDATRYPRIPFTELLDKLIAFMSDSKRYLNAYSSGTTTSLNTNISGYANNSYMFFINKRILLGDLYLWRGEYTKASAMYKYVSDIEWSLNTNAGDSGRYNRFKPSTIFLISYGGVSGANENALLYDETSGWGSMFMGDNRISNQISNLGLEWLWTIPFDKNYLPQNPFIDLFSNQGGKYQLTTSQLALDYWNSQTQRNGLPYDARGRISVQTIAGQPVIAKQLYYYLNVNTLVPSNTLERDGRWLIYRTGYLALRQAEAANSDNQVKVAYALVNVGIAGVFANQPAPNQRRTMLPPPYDLNAKDAPERDAWYTQIGTRTRANLQPLPTALYENNDKTGMEDAIIQEDALELAFEGHRWGDLQRIARRRNDPSFLAEKVYQKLLREGNPAAASVRAKLMSVDGWYLPLNF